jgi:hypothetical protein
MLKRDACSPVKMKINKYIKRKVAMIVMICMTQMKGDMFSKMIILSKTAHPIYKIQIPKTQFQTIFKVTKKIFTTI